jgi:acyl-CoA thioesterase
MSGPGRSEFDVDTALDEAGDGWQADITARWDIRGNPNGGYLLAILGRAMAARAEPAEPLTVTAHYLRPFEHGPADVTSELIRDGRRFKTAVASLSQSGKERARAIGTFGRLPSGPPVLDRTSPPDLPPPEDCPNILDRRPPEGLAAPPEIFHRFELRVGPGVGWTSGRRTGNNEVTGWIRFADGRAPDPLSLLLFADAFPPAVLDTEVTGWVPTLELTVHVRARPVAGWLRTRFRTRLLRDALLEEDGELWDDDGQLVAMSRQLALLLPPS